MNCTKLVSAWYFFFWRIALLSYMDLVELSVMLLSSLTHSKSECFTQDCLMVLLLNSGSAALAWKPILEQQVLVGKGKFVLLSRPATWGECGLTSKNRLWRLYSIIKVFKGRIIWGRSESLCYLPLLSSTVIILFVPFSWIVPEASLRHLRCMRYSWGRFLLQRFLSQHWNFPSNHLSPGSCPTVNNSVFILPLFCFNINRVNRSPENTLILGCFIPRGLNYVDVGEKEIFLYTSRFFWLV